MLSIFNDHLIHLESEITEYEEKLAEKKQEVLHLNELQSQVGQALDTLKTVVNAIKDIDEKAITMLKEAALSLFQQTASEKDVDLTPVALNQQPENQINLETGTTTCNAVDEEHYLSEQVLYVPSSQTTIIGLKRKSDAECLQTAFKVKPVGDTREVRKATKIKTNWELVIVGLSEEEAQYLAENLNHYLQPENQNTGPATIQKTKKPESKKAIVEEIKSTSKPDNQIEKDKIKFEQIIYVPSEKTALIGFKTKSAAKHLQTWMKHKQLGHSQKIRKATKLKSRWELVVLEISETEVAQNLGHYTIQKENPSSAPLKTSLKRKQRVKVISPLFKQFLGQIGQIVSMYNDNGAYVHFDSGITKFFWDEQLQPV